MSSWDQKIFSNDDNIDFLDEIADLDEEDILEAVRDAVLLAADQYSASDEERTNGLAAATITAIWAGAPFSAGEIAERFPFIRGNSGELDEQLIESAAELLEAVGDEEDEDVEQFLEALA